jgi:hypothetical protein
MAGRIGEVAAGTVAKFGEPLPVGGTIGGVFGETCKRE